MIIREMEMDDIERVAEIEAQNFARPWTAVGLFTYFMREDARFFVAVEGEEVAGYCGVLISIDEGDITNVAVEKSQQGKGIGTKLVQAMIRNMEEAGVTTLHLEVRASNENARKLYEKAGFVQDHIRKAYYSEPIEDGIAMSRRHSH